MLIYYNVTAEFVSMILAIFVLYLMVCTKPRKTVVFALDIIGLLVSVSTILTHFYILYMTEHQKFFIPVWFNLFCILFILQYCVLLNLIYTYVICLSSEIRNSRKKHVLIPNIVYFICFAIYCYFLFSGKMYTITENRIILTSCFFVYLIFGMFDVILILTMCTYHSKTFARTVFRFICIFCPIILIVLVAQFVKQNIIFSGMTYVFPFVIFYLLFHSNPYNEISGCQNKYSFDTRFEDNVRYKRNFMVVEAKFPRVKRADESFIRVNTNMIATEKCRSLEAIHRNVHLYSFNNYHYALFANINDSFTPEYLLSEIEKILKTPTDMAAKGHHIHYKVIAYNSNDIIKNTQHLTSFQNYLFSKLDNNMKNQIYLAKEEDYQFFNEQYQVEQLLNDIKTKMNLEDERVLCYAQPIFSVEHNSFRTAEALMRLQLNGKIIYPDKFIALAEQTGCIHTLTCIMLNKVCKKIAELGSDYDFDGITINCSTTELSDPNLNEELLRIINTNNIDCSKIRLELTESAMFEDYDAVYHNINKLKESGVQFYLDDFGTGYSNLERIITCPFNTIKFDKSLLYKSIDNSSVDDLVISMVDVFKKNGFTLLVEGVEDEEQNQYSIDRGFSYIQGYKYAKPVPIAELINYFTAKH